VYYSMIEKKFVLVTDSTTDMPESWHIENDIKVIPQGFVIDGNEVIDDFGKNITAKEIYNRIRQGEMPSTLQGTLEKFIEVFVTACKNGMDVLYVGFSSGLSGTFNTALIASREIMEHFPDRKIFCVDSLAATMGHGIQVIEALKLRDSGMDAAEAARLVTAHVQNACHFFTVDDLNHLYRGGRLSKATAMLGTLIGIKPIMYVNESGHLLPISKTRGRKASIAELARLAAKYIVKPLDQTIYIAHGDCESDANDLAQQVLELIPNAKTHVFMLSPIIGVHSGPGTLAVLFWGEKRL
ncbi:MAG: DegV family protein, partial [Angelakisella sp.]